MSTTYATDLKLKELAYRKLESKNTELEKELKESKEGHEAVAAWYIESLNQFLKSQKKLEIAVECLCRVENATDSHAIQQENRLINDLVNEALVAINKEGV